MQKFAKRHTSSGNSYLRMFNEIAKQTAFEEADLKKKYKSFARMKVYLKDMIVESMLVYHRNNHPHMQLFNHIQKAHFLLGKGMYAESLTIVEESIKMCTKMELFPIERYLQRLRTELKAHKFNTIDDVSVMRDEYFDRVSVLLKSDTNLLELEVKNFE